MPRSIRSSATSRESPRRGAWTQADLRVCYEGPDRGRTTREEQLTDNDAITTTLLVIADDFTGACDTAAQFAQPGAPCAVCFADRLLPEAVIVDTESRHLAPSAAAERTRLVATAPAFSTRSVVFKKIDSTFRGNVAAELEALLRCHPRRVALVAPAFPAAGRATVAGRCVVNGLPLDRTEFARDPHAPVRTSEIASLVRRASTLPRRPVIHATAHGIAAALDKAPAGSIVIADASTDADLDSVIAAAPALSRLLLVGSAGLAGAVIRARTAAVEDPRAAGAVAVRRGPVLGVVGSLSERTRAQLARLCAAGAAHLVTVDCLPDDGIADDAVALAAETVRANLHAGRSVVLASPEKRHDESVDVVYLLARAAVTALSGTAAPAGLFFTGGETAVAVARSLGVERVDVYREIASGVPAIRLRGPLVDIPAISKAGGFGEDSIMIDAFACLEEGRCLQ